MKDSTQIWDYYDWDQYWIHVYDRTIEDCMDSDIWVEAFKEFREWCKHNGGPKRRKEIRNQVA